MGDFIKKKTKNAKIAFGIHISRGISYYFCYIFPTFFMLVLKHQKIGIIKWGSETRRKNYYENT